MAAAAVWQVSRAQLAAVGRTGTARGTPAALRTGCELLKATSLLCSSSSSAGAAHHHQAGDTSMLLACCRAAAGAAQSSVHLQPLLQARLLSVFGTVLSNSSSGNEWAGHEATHDTVWTAAEMICAAVRHCCLLLSEVQLPGQAATAAEAAQQLQEQAAELSQRLQLQLQTLRQAEQADPKCVADGLPPPAAARRGGAEGGAAAAADQQRGENSPVVVSLQQEMRRGFPGDLPQQLQQLGEAVCHQLPVSLWCCNPRCTNLQKQSELELVGGKGCVCSGCHTARFCSRSCLEQCWKKQLHKGVCKRIAAARQQQQSAEAGTVALKP